MIMFMKIGENEIHMTGGEICPEKEVIRTQIERRFQFVFSNWRD